MPDKSKYKKAKESLRQKKKRARAIREGKGVMKNEDNSVSTHKMASGNVDNKNVAFPTVFPKKGGGYEEKEGWDGYDEAEKRGEVFEFKKEKQAHKFASGSWKKGKAKREAMRKYREHKRKK